METEKGIERQLEFNLSLDPKTRVVKGAFLERIFKASGLEDNKAVELTKNILDMDIVGNLSFEERGKQIRRISAKYGISETIKQDQHRGGLIEVKSVQIFGPHGGTRSFPGPVYKK